MLVVIGLTAAASMRGAISSEKVVNNLRLEALAQQYAEMALKYCESQIALDSADRVAALRDDALTPTVAISAASWQQTTTWLTAGNAAVVPSALVSNAADSSFVPPRLPECLVDRVSLASGAVSYVVTARGFSPGYAADATTGRTTSGAVVWLQSIVATN